MLIDFIANATQIYTSSPSQYTNTAFACKRGDEALASGHSQAVSENRTTNQSEVVNRNFSSHDQQALRQKGYQIGVRACEQRTQHLINEAIQTERNETAEQLTAAVAEKEKAVEHDVEEAQEIAKTRMLVARKSGSEKASQRSWREGHCGLRSGTGCGGRN